MIPKAEAIKGYIIRVISLGTIVAHSSEVVVLRVGTLCVSYISIKVSLIGEFKLYFKLLMEARLVLMVIMSRVMLVFKRFFFYLF